MSGRFPFDKLSKQPGIGQCAAANRNRMATGFQEHSFPIGNGSDVSIADDRNPLNRFDDFANSSAIDRTAKSLLARSTVDRNGSYTDLLEFASERRGGQLSAVPTQPHFDSHRNGDRFNNGPNEFHRPIRLTHQTGASADFSDSVDGTAHVDID